ncbi:MAG TPA: xylulose 5-phosphate 3-epimerase [Anaerolineae bacterium]|nr:xylulose 5-phosphate 3-epimerase [Anaerolineae bacterium]HCC79197.1 xylulose 5-phosphate 3-epimerase [Anaerolineae bacterium]HCM97530.1 xylulose 5-phosphate 3-epimerase [Anaerolineae bacterium]
MMYSLTKIPVGVYEKAFPAEYSWEQILTSAKQAGYDFVEISIDESPERLDRLDWSHSDRAVLRQAIFNTEMPVWGMGISAHRKFPLGSASSDLRRQGLSILYRSIELAADLGVKVIQIMGYDAFYEPSNAETQARYLEGLRTGVSWASAAGVLLALENGDSELVDSVEKAMRFVKLLNSPWFQVYPDIGNMTAAGYSPLEQLPLTEGHLVGVHVKDTRPGELRGVPLGQGIVRFQETFRLLARTGFAGPLVMEMWAHLDPTGDPIGSVTRARAILDRWIADAWSELPIKN